jgi:Outer membrane protein beta-barrel domain
MSSEKRFEHIENKIKEAVENNHIVFEEESWKKMEALLDKEDKRKPFFWLWILIPFALLSTYGLFTFSKNNDKAIAKNINENKIKKIDANKKPLKQIPTSDQQINTSEDTKGLTNDPDNVVTNIAKAASITTVQNKNIYSSVKRYNSINSSLSLNSTNISTTKNGKGRKGYALQNNIKIDQQSKTKTAIKNADASDDEVVFESKINNRESNINIIPQKSDSNLIAEIKKDATIIVAKNLRSKKEKKEKSKILSRFYVLGAAGTDIGSVKPFSFSNGSFSSKYGASIGYSIGKKVNVQAGFYASKKIYTAGPENYNIKDGTYLSTVPITKVEAACLIYELPILLQYYFLQKKSFNVYAGAGISSYIMKSEDYNYFYTRYNREYSRAYTYNGNDHLFSTALLSAGIEKNITKKLAIQLEPTVSIPLKGVGDGQVKLFSTSLLLGVKYKPFNK